jgi:predicted outer membrane protein
MYHKFMKTLAWALAVLVLTSTLALAGGQKMTGTIVAVATEVVTVKGADGNTYQIEAARVIAENLKTGDVVEYDIVEGKVVNLKKK